jgi:hypothetical protein
MKGGIPAESVKAMKGSKANAMPPKTVQSHGSGASGSQVTLTTAGTYASFKGTPKGPPKKSLPRPPYGMPTAS